MNVYMVILPYRARANLVSHQMTPGSTMPGLHGVKYSEIIDQLYFEIENWNLNLNSEQLMN